MDDDKTGKDDKIDNDEGKATDDNKGADDTKSSDTDDKSSSGKVYTPEEYEALQRRMQAADRNATAAQQKIQQLEDEKKDALTRAQDQAKRLAEENAELKKQNRTITLKNDFFQQNVVWHNPGTAYATLLNEYPDAVSVNDDGTVSGMKAAVEKLVKEHAYLVKPKDSAGEEDDQASAATGPVKNGKRKGEGSGGDAAAVKAAMRKRMPALASKIKS